MTSQDSPSPRVCSYRPLRTVLIGTSLQGESDQVVRSGLAVARAAGGRVYLVHVALTEPLLVGFEGGLGPGFLQEQIDLAEEKLRRQIERLGIREAELAGVTVRTGTPHRVLIEVAQTVGADLIVVGATGSGPFAAELLGSTADRVLRKASCPVLVVRGELKLPLRRVLAPVDLSNLSADAFHCGLDLLGQLAKGEETEVRAVYAWSFLDLLAMRQATGEVSGEQMERSAGDELRRFVLENRGEAPLPVETAVLPGEARFEILQELSERPADLVMLGTHGRGGLDRLVLGSVASTVARKAPCSVLLISPDATLAHDLAEAVANLATPAWHREPVPAV